MGIISYRITQHPAIYIGEVGVGVDVDVDTQP